MADRNFDELADRFEQRIYGKLKGKIRQEVIWRDLNETIPTINKQNSLNILDLGAGLGQFSIALAELGHHVCYNDISQKMLQKAQQAAADNNLVDKIKWHHGPYQDFIDNKQQRFDIILCHALLEWLDDPQQLINTIKPALKDSGFLSLCFYNPMALVYRNLMRGNFHVLNNGFSPQANSQGFTPNNACHFDDVEKWLSNQELTIKNRSGIRVFSDYAREKRGGLNSEDSIIEMELKYSKEESFWRLGRYLHVIAEN